jgi:hypothetical protein
MRGVVPVSRTRRDARGSERSKQSAKRVHNKKRTLSELHLVRDRVDFGRRQENGKVVNAKVADADAPKVT